LIWISAYAFIDPPTTPYMLAERARLGDVDQQWVPLSEVSPYLSLSVVAAEDANFCQHWGFDMAAIRAAVASGATRGGSTISQQMVKNVFLWQGRSWSRKALEALITPVVELIWTKRRILEVYLNVIEFDEGVFGIEAAARRAFDTGPESLTPREAALIATVLPNPKRRSARQPSQAMSKRARAVADGAATIAADGRAACFQD
ncbi:MAG TPA: monofunctional biosynthetic peptidoglycan transglycosylase, partial [Aliiroseovarius sp.]|nr:monofunctional biosynthetic peptidoglycan transglycosylase [Aliiroseovarius sp.]